MTGNSIILRHGSLTLSYEPDISDDVKDILLKSVLGSPDGIRYRLLETLKTVEELKPISFFPLRKNGELISMIALSERITSLCDVLSHTFYVCFVNFNPAYSVKNITDEGTASREKLGNSFIKEALIKHAESLPNRLQDPEADPSKKIYYAFVEESNLRSLNFTRFFFTRVRSLSIITFSSLFPKADKRFEPLSDKDLEWMYGKLKTSYRHHSLFFLDKDSLTANYYILKEGDEIVAGIRANITSWKIEQLPGLLGKILIRIIPLIPLLNRVIRKSCFRFLGFDTPYFKEGKSHLLPKLFSSICAEHKIYAGMVYLDSDDFLNRDIYTLRNMGFLNKLYKGGTGVVAARFVNFPEEEIKKFCDSPVYVSGYDLN